ncbi:hypothetical protein BpHYR1_036947 [Brachionus plicatilis]|uniref:MULE transposase domain-containing protein n=1 Tax=Brachionus plicatilis TaxID=10195 RepID=A0A3M7S980_BRAPC|nr:hypothetical protein BpHYR1_036947 [Brachionus plicatilis]
MNIFRKKNLRLTNSEAEEMLTSFNHADGNHNPKIFRPRSGEVVFYWSDQPEKYKDWLSDGFKWRNQGGKKPFPVDKPVLFKSYYHIFDKGIINKNIIKDVYTLIDKPMPVLIHYLKKNNDSDSEIECESGPHGNTKDQEGAQNYQRTMPSVLSELKEKVAKKVPNLVYKETSKKKGARDLKQIQNLRYAVNRQKRFTYDEIANCHLMHISLGYPNHILTAPDIRIIGVDEELLKETKKTMSAFNKDNRLAKSEKSPAVPLAFFFHEKKFQKSHDEFWRYMSEILPEFSECGFIITDCEDAFRNAIKKYFPSVPLLRCWNHFWKSTERWIQSNKKLTIEDVGFYCESLRELLLQPNKEMFKCNKLVNNVTIRKHRI